MYQSQNEPLFQEDTSREADTGRRVFLSRALITLDEDGLAGETSDVVKCITGVARLRRGKEAFGELKTRHAMPSLAGAFGGRGRVRLRGRFSNLSVTALHFQAANILRDDAWGYTAQATFAKAQVLKTSLHVHPLHIHTMDTLDGTEWDVLLDGTGFRQSLLAL
jgi:hypothetical protein